MKRNDFLQNLLLIILSAVLAACIVYLACLGALPVTYTSHARVQLTGDALHVGDIKEFAGYIEGDEALRNKAIEACVEEGRTGGAEMKYHVATATLPEEGIIDIYVKSDNPYTSHSIEQEIVKAAYSDYPASHEGLSVNLVEAASVAAEPDHKPITGYTILGAIFGAAFGTFLSFAAVKGEREKRRRKRISDPRFARIEEDEAAYDSLFAEDNEDVDPEMRELYKVTKRAEADRGQKAPLEEGVSEDPVSEETAPEQPQSFEKNSPEGRMSEEAEAAYLEAMEIEAAAADIEDKVEQSIVAADIEDKVEHSTAAADIEDKVEQSTAKDTETEGGDHYEE